MKECWWWWKGSFVESDAGIYRRFCSINYPIQVSPLITNTLPSLMHHDCASCGPSIISPSLMIPWLADHQGEHFLSFHPTHRSYSSVPSIACIPSMYRERLAQPRLRQCEGGPTYPIKRSMLCNIFSYSQFWLSLYDRLIIVSPTTSTIIATKTL